VRALVYDGEMTLVDRICAALENGGFHEQVEATLTASFLIEKALGREPAGWNDEVLAEPVDRDTIPRLRESLVRFIERHVPPPPVSSAISALKLLDDRGLVPLFVSCLQEHARGGSDTGVLYQAMDALDRLGERIFPDKRSSLLEAERNLQLANEYLAKKRSPERMP
jgi:hypothetical protein